MLLPERVRQLGGGRAGSGAGHGLVRNVQGPQGNESGLWQNDPSADAAAG